MNDINVNVGTFTIMVGPPAKQRRGRSMRVPLGSRGWLVLGDAAPGQLRPTTAHGLICDGDVTIKGGAVAPSVRAKLEQLAAGMAALESA